MEEKEWAMVVEEDGAEEVEEEEGAVAVGARPMIEDHLDPKMKI